MAVQAQYPSYVFGRCPIENQQQLNLSQMQSQQLQTGFLGVPCNGISGVQMLNESAMFSEPGRSELTTNNNNNNNNNIISLSTRKRGRDDIRYIPQTEIVIPLQKRYLPATIGGVEPNLVSEETNRSVRSSMSSTSGSSSAIDLYQHNFDVDSLLRLEYEKLKAALMETTKRNYRNFVSILGQNFQKHLNEKESELQIVIRRNAELEEKLKQVTEETQIWFTLAKNTETVVADLRSNLDRVLVKNKEGYGETEAVDQVFAFADDAQSCCFDEEQLEMNRVIRTCRSCGCGEASVLILPCRHLCLCESCEPVIGTCPVCNSVKNAGLSISLV